jgi:5-methylcytosine-specific restriction endonuclease McrA
MAESLVQRQRRLREIGRKHCNGCDTEKDLSEFYPRPSRPNGYVSRCKTCVLAVSKAYRESRPDYYRERNRAWREAHPKNSTAWARANRHRHLEQHQASRFRLVGQFVEDVDRRVLWESHGGICGICQEPVAFDEFQIDHIIPKGQGGLHSYANTQPSHAACNSIKSLREGAGRTWQHKE